MAHKRAPWGEAFAFLQWSRDKSLNISSQIDKHSNQEIFSPPNNLYFLTFEACFIESPEVQYCMSLSISMTNEFFNEYNMTPILHI